jgi:hypothetical protein
MPGQNDITAITPESCQIIRSIMSQDKKKKVNHGI